MTGRALLLLGLAASPAAAQPVPPAPPRLQPARDVVVTYVVEGQALSLIPGGIPGPVRLSWEAAGRRVRAESEGRSQVALLDLNAGTAIAFDTTLRVTMPLPLKPSELQPLTLEGARLTRTGRDTVAGMPCTTYRIETGHTPGAVCLTADGVALRGSGDFNGRPGKFVATSVSFGRLSPTLFAVPSGYITLGGGGASGALAGALGKLGGGSSLSDLKSLGGSLLGRTK